LIRTPIIFAHERHKHFPDNRLGEPSSGTAAAYNPGDLAGKARLVYTVKTGDNLGIYCIMVPCKCINDLRHWNNIKGNIDQSRTEAFCVRPGEPETKV
jgi:membrane-bound lytic murein transglycosylase D